MTAVLKAPPAAAPLKEARAGRLTLAQVMDHAQQLQLSGQAEAAAQLYDTWIRHTDVPLKQVACFNWGTLLSALQRDDEAEKAYELALTLAPEFPPALLNLGHLYERRGDKERALSSWALAIARTDPPSPANFDLHLHALNNSARLLESLKGLRDLGNSVLVVEHDEEAIMTADYVIDMGPAAGVHGGHIVAEGKPADVMANPDSITGQYLSGVREITVPQDRRPISKKKVLRVIGATGNNLKNVTAEIPVGTFTCITGVSGGGKSTFTIETLYKAAARRLHNASDVPAPHERIEGLEQFDKVIDIDQSPIGRTPRSNPATYTGAFQPIRDWFAGLPESKARGYGPGRFSFNVKGGRCEACQGDGLIKIEMHFLPDVYVTCDVCHGKRYNRETLEVLFKGKSISDVLDMTVEEAADFFKAVPTVRDKMDTLKRVGLSYIKVGQSATTLSGGEAQRVKLSKELSRRATGKTLYILDEPTTGLHFEDIKKLLEVLHELADQGNTMVVIEHNLDVVKTADWIVDFGPEGGDGGGEIVAQGSPEDIAANSKSWTGRYLAEVLQRHADRRGARRKLLTA